MMGRLNHDQRQFFYSFCLEEAVPDDHPVRGIAAILDLSWVHSELAPFYPKIGRPSIDPELMIRMLVLGYVFAIRSERSLCRDVQVNFAYRWFCGLSIEDKVPDHSAFSRARHERFRESDMLRRVFERVVEACIAAGLVSGEGFAVDASLIVADANKQRSVPGTEWKKSCARETASRAMREYLATLDDAAFGAASEVTPKFVSPSDPAAQWTGATSSSPRAAATGSACRCQGCGCKGGPGWRGKNGQCVSHANLTKDCGSPPSTRCTHEGAQQVCPSRG
jgi:transposase